MNTSDLSRLNKYADQSRHYEANAFHLLANGEPAKAGEMLWGTVSQLLKAIAATAGQVLRNHDETNLFVSGLKGEVRRHPVWTNDADTLETGWAAANRVHRNFYQSELSDQEFLEAFESTRALIAFLWRFLKNRLDAVADTERLLEMEGQRVEEQ